MVDIVWTVVPMQGKLSFQNDFGRRLTYSNQHVFAEFLVFNLLFQLGQDGFQICFDYFLFLLFVLFVTALMPSLLPAAPLKVHGVFSSHMVLQRGKPIVIWGWAEQGKVVTVQFGEEKQEAKAEGEKGRWEVTFPASAVGLSSMPAP